MESSGAFLSSAGGSGSHVNKELAALGPSTRAGGLEGVEDEGPGVQPVGM